ncbi:MAG TPA: potassium-transporting ATPase subunit KdpC [Methanobacteriaceae archaeon]|nr:potassium-transporting ATPase subunit KdpC [Methanobacteriaceae archaeon]
MKQIKNAIVIFVVFTILLGIIYPLAITGVSQLAFPVQANGNLIRDSGKVVGSQLIGQNFSSPSYFHGRPSVIDYNSSTSGGSNFGPTNKKLIDNITLRMQQLKVEDSLPANVTVPADLVLASGSGLEGYIYVDSAMIQVPRIARTRGISESEVEKLIKSNQENTFFGFGKEIVNVLKLNLALDNLKKGK